MRGGVNENQTPNQNQRAADPTDLQGQEGEAKGASAVITNAEMRAEVVQ